MNDMCRKFEASLIDLVYGELPENTANEFRSHAEKCHHCRTLLDETELTRKMAASLPSLKLEKSLDETVKAAAREFAEARARKKRRSGIAFFEKIRGIIPFPVVAAAAVASVAVAFILYYPDEAAEPAETILARTEMPQAESPGFERLREEEAQPEDRRPELPSNSRTNKPRGAPRLREDKAAKKSRTLGSRPLARPPSSPLEQEVEQVEIDGFQENELSTVAEDSTRRADERSFASSPRKKEGGFATGHLSGSSRSGQVVDDDVRSEAAQISAMAKSSPPKAEQMAKPSASMGADIADNAREREDEQGSFARGMAAYRRGDYSSAKEHFLITTRSAQGDQKPRVMHYLARCEKGSGRCGEAVKWYEKLLVDYPTYRDRGSALWEASLCHRRLGHVEKSRILLRELSTLPGWEHKATLELEKISD